MKKIIGLFALLFLFVINCLAQSNASWIWATEGSILPKDSIGNCEGLSVARDQKDNTYLTGYVSDTVTVGTFELDSYVYENNAYIIKYNEDGSVLWVQQSRENSRYSSASASSIAIDDSGYVYITGNFVDTVTFGGIQLKQDYLFGGSLMFLVKYDMNGNLIWAKQSNSSATSSSEGDCIAIDKEGNIYVTGISQDTVSFDSITLYSTDNSFFTVKYDPSGNVIWAKQPEMVSSTNLISFGSASISVDKLNNIYITGTFADTLIIGQNVLVSPVGQAYFIAKYNSDGNLQWAKQSFVSSNTFRLSPALTTDNSDNIYVTGGFDDTLAFGKIKLLSPNIYSNIFLIKFDSSGNAKWAKSSKSAINSWWIGFEVITDLYGHVYISGGDGSFTGHQKNDTIQFDADTLTVSNASYDGNSVLVEFDTSGNILCGTIIAGGGDDENTIVINSSGKYIYFGGDMFNGVQMGTDYLPYYGTEVPFISEWEPCSSISGIKPIEIDLKNLYPNPNDGNFIINIPSGYNTAQIEIYNLLGKKIYTSNLYQKENRITLFNPVPGIYLYRVNDKQNLQFMTGKIVVQ